MNRFVFLSFLFMGWAFYELSDGADFEPASLRENASDAPQSIAEPSTVVKEETLKITQANADLSEAATSTASTVAVQRDPTPKNLIPTPSQTSEMVAELPLATGLQNPTTQPIFSLASLESAPPFSPSVLRKDIRIVQPLQVNVRSGPGTEFEIVSRVPRGTKIDVLQDTDTGWVSFLLPNGESTGWVSALLLVAENG